MAECIVLKGGGADLDAVTAGASDVLAGKVIVGSDGEPLTGTLALSGNATAGQVLAGSTFYNTDPKNKLTGTISSLGGQTINPSASQQTVSSSGKYMTGNVVVNAVSNLAAANIKKGAVVGGVTGTFEGYVPTATDLYLRGNNVAGFTASSSLGVFDAGQITITQSGSTRLLLTASFSIVGYNYLNLEGNTTNSYDTIRECRLYRYDGSDWKMVGSNDAQINPGNYTKSINISATQISGQFRIQLFQMAGSLYRIWLS